MTALLLAPLAALLWLALVGPSAEAQKKPRITANASLQTTSAGATRAVVNLRSNRRVKPRQRPRRVSLRGGGKTYRLRPVGRSAGGATVSNRRLGRWRSAALSGSRGEELRALAGQRVLVIVQSRAGRTRVRTQLRGPSGGGPGDGGPGDGGPGDGGPGDGGPGDITGQPAIDQMTSELRGQFFRIFISDSTSSTSAALHLCADGRFRYREETTFSGPVPIPPSASEYFGDPWTVIEAVIRSNGDRGARVRGTATVKNEFGSGQSQVNEEINATIERLGGQWHMGGRPAQTGAGASCEPSF